MGVNQNRAGDTGFPWEEFFGAAYGLRFRPLSFFFASEATGIFFCFAERGRKIWPNLPSILVAETRFKGLAERLGRFTFLVTTVLF